VEPWRRDLDRLARFELANVPQTPELVERRKVFLRACEDATTTHMYGEELLTEAQGWLDAGTTDEPRLV
jgi:hypothetical protein